MANIALHGLEKAISKSGVYLVRYADDFLVLCNEDKYLYEAKIKVKSFLEDLGLELSESKTRITFSGNSSQRRAKGIDFLGYNFVNYKVGINSSAKNRLGIATGWTYRCRPSYKSI